MLGIFFSSIESFFEEIGSSIGKDQVTKQLQSLYTMGCHQHIWGMILFALIALIRPDTFVFSSLSLPTFLARLLFETAQAHVSILAIIAAERSTFGFVRVGTIPLLLLVDLTLGYPLGMMQIIGIGIVILTLIAIFLGKTVSKRGIGLVLFSTINAVITISLYKYNITYFNSVVAEQLIVHAVLFVYFALSAAFRARENFLSSFFRSVTLVQSLANAGGTVIGSFAYSLIPASVAMAAKRSSAVLWSTLSGNFYFKEQHFLSKLALVCMLIAGLIFLAL